MVTEKISSLLSGLGATLNTAREVRKIYDKDLALDFSPILSFWKKIGENKLSEILAFFLNPNEAHGQGFIFLESFIKSAFPTLEIAPGKNIKIQCEASTDEKRRLDIYIRLEDSKFGIGIENKIWAKDQPRQLADYNTFLEQRHNDNYCLLYLTSYNRLPDECSITKDEREKLVSNKKLHFFDHSTDVSNLIKEWIKICQAEKVRIFLKDLYRFIQHEINGEKFMGQNELIADYVTAGGEERLKVALAIESASYVIKQKLIEIFKKQLKEIAEELKLTSRGLGTKLDVQQALSWYIILHYSGERKKIGFAKRAKAGHQVS